ncbi:IS1 family transposase ISOba3 [Asticcacaulis sp. MM231]|uniref:IS1 family transposase n=1 Tax=Asticcacaulis sp. MM231 TaxID=3157666 RepID=UPI0032D5A949
MNRLTFAKRTQILAMLCEGSSMRSISRVVDVSINTVTKLLVDAGETCLELHNELVRDVQASRIQCNEIWSFRYTKAHTVLGLEDTPEGDGDVWTWTALDADTKLMVSYYVGDRSAESAMVVLDDLRCRIANRVQLITDGHKAYLQAVEGAFGGDIDYAQLLQIYSQAQGPAGRYSPAKFTAAKKTPIEDGSEMKHVSTSYVERSNLTIRMSMRRFTRLTNAFSKKIDNHVYALALYFAFDNFTRIHKTLKVTPAMAAGITDKLWTLEDIAERIEARVS